MANKSADIVWADDDGIIHVRNSERGTLDRCPQQWWWSWREGLRAKETAKPLWFGTGIHLALADYYRPGKKRSKDYIDIWRESIKNEEDYIRVNVGDPDEAEWVDAKELGESMLTEYVKHWGGDKHWDVIATEQEFEVKIPWPQNAPCDSYLTTIRAMILDGIKNKYGDYFILNGTFDGVYRDTNDHKFKLMEHKTAASISVGHLPMDNQAGTYWMVAGTVGHHQGWLAKRENISEITYNFLRKAMPDDRPRDAQGYATNKPLKAHYQAALAGVDGWSDSDLKKKTLPELESIAAGNMLLVLGDRSKRQPPPLFDRHPVRKRPTQRKQQLARIQDEVVRMTMMVDGILTVTKAPSRDCSFCSFKDMCELHEADSDWMEYKRAMYRSTDPYADHRKSA